jgi:hypothetical protein
MSLRTTPDCCSTFETTPLTVLEPSDGYGPLVSVAFAMQLVTPVPPLELELLELDELELELLDDALALVSLPPPPQPTRSAAEPPASSQDSARRRSAFRCIINARSYWRPWSWSWRSVMARSFRLDCEPA